MSQSKLGSALPPVVKQRLRPFVRQVRNARAARSSASRIEGYRRELESLPVDRPPDDSALQRLYAAWGNPKASDSAFMARALDATREVDGPVLELGSGLSTTLFDRYSPQPVISLESHAGWARQVEGLLTPAGRVSLFHAPLVQRDGYDWYDWSSVPIPAGIALVICDGPPVAARPGGRFGLLPEVGHLLAPGALILVDRAMHTAEGEAIDRWCSEFGVMVGEETPDYVMLRVPAEVNPTG